ncbi:MAG: hypothetical protein NZT61_00615 [Deltaproteobacteria bacterium]|nr:hypothetical protein [Deltaproteobacteria bacterium]MCX7952014.1 hypothetical protein [Deltaproteobacteria bacterium]
MDNVLRLALILVHFKKPNLEKLLKNIRNSNRLIFNRLVLSLPIASQVMTRAKIELDVPDSTKSTTEAVNQDFSLTDDDLANIVAKKQNIISEKRCFIPYRITDEDF